MSLIEPFVEPGAYIGPYHVLEELGTGGSGQVLKVEDVRTGEVRALKVRFRRRGKEGQQPSLNLRRELRAMRRCDHPNIARAYEIGVTDGFAYLVMEYVPGLPIDEFLYRTGLPPGLRRDRLVAFLGMQIASALEHIHGRNLIHRDVKPANILVTSSEVVKIIDFGIARDVARGEFVDPGDLAGTYAYCSPEQVSEVPLDHRSDLYSLGVVLYEMLTDHLPFTADSPFSFVVKHITAEPEPIETHYPAVSSLLRELVLRLLAKKPKDRPQRSLEVERALKEFVERFDQDRRGPRAALYGAASATAAAGRLLEPEFVDRSVESIRLHGAVSLLEAGVGGGVLLMGNVGAGKSRLLDEVLADVRGRGIAVFGARCLPQSDRPYQCLLELVALMAESVPESALPLVRTMVGTHLPILARVVPQVARLLPDEPGSRPDPNPAPADTEPSPSRSVDTQPARGAAIDATVVGLDAVPVDSTELVEVSDDLMMDLDDRDLLDPCALDGRSRLEPSATPDWSGEDERRLLEAVRAFLTLVPAVPTVLAIKDLQWADATLVSLLHDLVATPPAPLSSPILWIGSVSTDELDGRQAIEPWIANPPPLVERVHVRPLGRRHVAQMVGSMLGGLEGLDRLAVQVHRLSGGNPLLVYETIRELVESGGLGFVQDGEGEGAWKLVRDDVLERLGTRTLDELLAERIDRLPEASVEVLEWLAVLGRPCPFEWLSAVTGMSEERLLDQVELLVARHVVSERVGRSRTTLAFYQPRCVDLIRRRIAPERLQRMRVRAADAWLAHAGGTGADPTELAAELLYRGGAYQRAVNHLLHASDRAARFGLHRQAFNLAEQAAGCCSATPDISPELDALSDLQVGRALANLGNLVPAIAYLQDARRKATAAGQRDIVGLAATAIGKVHARSGHLRRAQAMLAGAVTALEPSSARDQLVECLDDLGRVRIVLGDLAGARACFNHLLDLPGGEDDAARFARAYRGRAGIALFEGRLPAARRAIEIASRECARWGDTRYALLCRLDRALIRFLSGDLAGGRAQLEQVQESLERSGAYEDALAGLVHQVSFAVAIRDLDRAAHLLERVDAVLGRAPNLLFQAWSTWQHARIAVLEQRFDQGRDQVEQAIAMARRGGFVELLVLSEALLGLVLVGQEAPDRGLQASARALETGDRHGCTLVTLHARLWHARVALEAGELEMARQTLDQVLPAASRAGLSLVLLRALLFRARAAADPEDDLGPVRDLEGQARRVYQELVRGLTPDERKRFDADPDMAPVLGRLEPDAS